MNRPLVAIFPQTESLFTGKVEIEILYLTYHGKITVLCLDAYLVCSGQRKKLPCYILSPKQSLRRCYLNKEGGPGAAYSEECAKHGRFISRVHDEA